MNKLFRFYSMFSKWYSVVITKSVGCEQDIVRVQYEQILEIFPRKNPQPPRKKFLEFSAF